MTMADCYRILDLPVNSSVNDIKKAYRKKAREYHPDINPSPDAIDIFIRITEAYDFLISSHQTIQNSEQEYEQAMTDWRKYRQDRSHKRATIYARTSFTTFKNTSFYKTTRIFNGTTIILSFVISILILVYAVTGYMYKLNNPGPGVEKPSVFAFIMLLLPGMIFFVFSLVQFKAYYVTSKKHKYKYNTMA